MENNIGTLQSAVENSNTQSIGETVFNASNVIYSIGDEAFANPDILFIVENLRMLLEQLGNLVS